MHTKTIRAGLLLLLIAAVFACGRRADNNEDAPDDPQQQNPAAVGTAADSAAATPVALTQTAAELNKKVVREASVRIETDDYKKTRTAVQALITRFGGYIAGETETADGSELRNVLTIRVANPQFYELVSLLAAEGKILQEKKISSQDLSAQYMDIESRVRARKAVEQRYLDFLNRANTIKEVLAIEADARHIREEIEIAEGRMRQISNQSVMSTVHLTFYQLLPAAPAPAGDGFWTKAGRNFVSGWEAILAILLSLIMIWPLWLAAALGYTAWRFYRHKIKPAVATIKDK
jgi:hypothetical protein